MKNFVKKIFPAPQAGFQKLLLTMKISFILSLFAMLQVNGAVFSQNLNLKLKDVALKEALKQIENRSDYRFFYSDDLLYMNTKVNLDANNSDVEEVLNKLLVNSPLTYRIFDNKLIIITPVAQPGSMKISGKITDATTGDPLPGVNIVIEGTTIGVTSDIDGKYSIEVPNNDAVLVFSYVGYLSENIKVAGQTQINVNLSPDIKHLDEVVVVGYGTQKKRDVTGAMASFKTENVEERPLARVDQVLVGQLAGVQVKQTSGALGKAFSVQVRGTGSISAGNEPLYVIDGFPLANASPNGSGNYSTGNPLDNINPNDIESIQVLKDASASAIYGSRAANGVVLITTKHGKSGKPKINFNTYVGVSEANRKLDMLNSSEWIDRATEMINAQWVASGAGRTADQTTDQRRSILGLGAGQYNTSYMIDDRWLQPGHPGLRFIDWQDETFRRAPVQNYQLSANGGNDHLSYYISGNYVKQEGMVKGMDYTSYSARANVEVTANDRLRFGINLAPTYSITDDPGVEGKDQILHQILTFSPVQEDTMGLYPNSYDFGQYRWSNSRNSPVAQLNSTIGRTQRFRTITSLYGEYEIIKGLKIKSTLNLDNIDNSTKSYTPYTVRSSLSARQAQLSALTVGSQYGYKKQTFVNENTLSYHKNINDKHDISVLAGLSYNSDMLSDIRVASSGGYTSSAVTTLNATVDVTGSTTETKNVLLSYFGRVQYNYERKYLLSASIRRDGSSRFGSNTKWGVFPSVSVGWRISDEGFMKDQSVVSDLKFRTSWGKSGNYNIGDYSSIPVLANYNYTFNGVQVTGQAPSKITNPDLTWEESATFDVGLDFGILQNRVTGSFDYYNKLNTKLLLNVPIPESTGQQTSLTNVGKVRNKGWEVELTSRNLTGSFQWTTSANLSHYSNKVEALGKDQTQILIPSLFDISHTILKVGEQMNSIYVVRQTGILSQQDIDNNAALYGTETVGDPKYYDANKDGTIDANDRVIVGHPNPDYVWGITNTFKFKGFDLSVLVQGQQGGSIYSLLGRALGRTGQGYVDNALGFYRDRWRSPSDPGAGRVGKAYSTFGRIVNTDWLYSSDYWRIRNITLGYDLGKVLKVKQVSDARIYITAENWFGKDKYLGGLNPEAQNTDLSGSTLYPEAGDYGGLPIARSIILGLNLTF